jgi:hypothetical protein
LAASRKNSGISAPIGKQRLLDKEKHSIFSGQIKQEAPICILWNKVWQTAQESYEQSRLVSRLIGALPQWRR